MDMSGSPRTRCPNPVPPVVPQMSGDFWGAGMCCIHCLANCRPSGLSTDVPSGTQRTRWALRGVIT